MKILIQSFALLFILLITVFDNHLPKLKSEILVFSGLYSCIIIYYGWKKKLSTEFILLLLFSFSLLLYSYLNCMYILPETPFPRFKLVFKFLYFVSLLCVSFIAFRYRSEELLFFITVFIGSNIFLLFFLYGETLRAIPICIYIGSYLIPKLLKQEWRNTNLQISVFVLLCIPLLFSLIFSWNFYDSIPGFSILYSGLLIFLSVPNLRIKHYKYLVRFLYFLYLLTILIFVVFVVVEIAKDTYANRHFMIGYNINSIGSVLVIATSIMVLQFFKKKRTLTILGFLMLAIVLFRTNSRAAVLGILFSMSVLIVLLRYKINKKLFFSILITFAISVALILVSLFVFSGYFKSWLKVESLQIRFLIWETVLSNTFHWVPLTGFGIENTGIISSLPAIGDKNTFFKIVGKESIKFHAHNLFVHTYFTMGFLGITSLVLFFPLLIKKFLSIPTKQRVFFLSAILPISGIGVQELFDYTLAEMSTLIPVAFFIGYLFRKSKAENYPNPIFQKIISFSILVIVLFLSVFAYNFSVNVYQLNITKKYLQYDLLGNFSYINADVVPKPQLEKALHYNRLKIFDNFNYRSKQLSGENYYTLYQKENDSKDLNMSEKMYTSCTKVYSRASFCYKRLSDIYSMQGKQEKARYYLQTAKKLDPYNLIDYER